MAYVKLISLHKQAASEAAQLPLKVLALAMMLSRQDC